MITFVTSTRTIPTRDGELPPLPPNSSQISLELRRLCVQLGPLRQVEENLISLLSGRTAPPRRRTVSQLKDADDPEVESLSKVTRLPQEIVLPSEGQWKGFGRTTRLSLDSKQPTPQSQDGQVRRTLATFGDEMVKLWEDSMVQSLLKLAELRLDEQPGLYVCLQFSLYFICNSDSFLDQIQRLTREDYIPRPGMLLVYISTFDNISSASILRGCSEGQSYNDRARGAYHHRRKRV